MGENKKKSPHLSNITCIAHRAIKLQKIKCLSGASPIFGEKTCICSSLQNIFLYVQLWKFYLNCYQYIVGLRACTLS